MLRFRDSKTVEFCVLNASLTFGGCGGVCLGVEEPVVLGPVISQLESGQWDRGQSGLLQMQAQETLASTGGPWSRDVTVGRSGWAVGVWRGCVCMGDVFDQVLRGLGIFPGQRAPRFPLAWEGGQEGAVSAGEEETLGR